MGILASTRRRQGVSGRWIMIPKDLGAPRRRRARVIRKRRQTFERLLVAAGSTLVLGLIPATRWMLILHLAVDVAVGVYVARLLRWKRHEEDEARRAGVEGPTPQDARRFSEALLADDTAELVRGRAVGD